MDYESLICLENGQIVWDENVLKIKNFEFDNEDKITNITECNTLDLDNLNLEGLKNLFDDARSEKLNIVSGSAPLRYFSGSYSKNYNFEEIKNSLKIENIKFCWYFNIEFFNDHPEFPEMIATIVFQNNEGLYIYY